MEILDSEDSEALKAYIRGYVEKHLKSWCQLGQVGTK